jgi:hypothetical protein
MWIDFGRTGKSLLSRTLTIAALLVCINGSGAWADQVTQRLDQENLAPAGTQETITVDDAFKAYCNFADAAPGVCARGDTLTQTQKFITMLSYCIKPGASAAFKDEKRATVCGQNIEVPLWIEYDHRTGKWARGPALAESRVDFTSNSRPEVKVGRNQELGVVVKETNPTLFAVRQGKVTETDIEELANLKTFFSSLGGALASLTQVLAVPKAAAPLAASASDANESAQPPPSPCEVLAAAALTDDLKWLDKVATPLKEAVGRLTARADRLLAQDTHFVAAARAFEASAATQHVRWTPALAAPGAWGDAFKKAEEALVPKSDSGQPIKTPAVCQTRVAAFRKILELGADKPADVHRLVLEFIATKPTNTAGTAVCGAELEKMIDEAAITIEKKAMAASTVAFPSDDAEKVRFTKAVQALNAELNEHRVCLLKPMALLSAALDSYVETATKTKAAVAADKRKELLTLSASLALIADRVDASAYRRHVTQRVAFGDGAVVKEVVNELCPAAPIAPQASELWNHGKTDAKVKLTLDRETFDKTLLLEKALSVELTVPAGKRVAFSAMLDAPSSSCPKVVATVTGAEPKTLEIVTYETEVDSVLFLPTDPFKGPWHKVRETEVIVSRGTALLKDVVSERANETTTSYKMVPRVGSLWGAGVGLVFTDISSRTYADVEKVVRETARESRTGSQAIFANYKFGQHFAPESVVKPGVEFGVAVDDDKPAILLGLSLETFRYARAGFGIGWFRTTQLISPQVGEPIPAGSSLQTRQQFSKRWYASFTFALDSLRLFGE